MTTTLIGREVLTRCPECGHGRLTRWGTARDRLHGLTADQYLYRRCRNCRLIFLAERPDEASAPALYPDHYAPYLMEGQVGVGAAAAGRVPVGSVTARVASIEKMRWPRALRRRVNRWWPEPLPPVLERTYAPPPDGVLVDYGCGRPAFLDRARATGWSHTIGVDLGGAVLDRVAAAGHRAVATDRFPDDVADGSVHVIRLNHVLEHVYHPGALLDVARRKLVVGGTLHVAVPNGMSIGAQIFRGRWYNADPRHLAFFSSSHLRRLADAAGFTAVAVIDETITRDLIRSYGYWRVDRGSLSPDSVAALVEDARRHQLLWYPARLAAATGRGDRVHAFLVK